MKLVVSLCLLGVVGIGTSLPFEPIDGILPIAGMVKGILSTDYGYQHLKAYLLSLDPTNDIVSAIHGGIRETPDEELKAAVNAFFSQVPILAIEPGFDYPGLKTLFGELKPILSSDEGIVFLRSYIQALSNSDNQIVQFVVEETAAATDAQLKQVVDVIFSKIDPVFFESDLYDIRSDLQRVVGHLKRILSTSAGILIARDHLKNIQTTNPNIILAKTILSSMSDRSLIDLVKEAAKNVPDVQVAPGDQEPNLLDLVRQAKDLAITPDGIQYIRTYFEKFETTNFLLVRVRGLLIKATDNEIKEILSKGYDEIFGNGYIEWIY